MTIHEVNAFAAGFAVSIVTVLVLGWAISVLMGVAPGMQWCVAGLLSVVVGKGLERWMRGKVTR